MARVDNITGEMIELLRGKVDFYLLRGILPVARRWPKKPKPPYTALQAEAMAVFAIANRTLPRITGSMLEKWRESSVGVKASWTDVFRSLIMKYWKKNKSLPLIVLDYFIFETETKFSVKWTVLQLYIDPGIKEKTYSVYTDLIQKEDFVKTREPIYFTLTSDSGERQVAPYLFIKIEEVISVATYSDISYFRRTGDVFQRWYTMPIITLAMGVSGALAANRIYAHPFVVPKDITLDRIAVNCTTGVAGGLIRLGIYSDLNGLANTLILDAGEVSTVGTGVKSIIISQSLEGGKLYWLAAFSNKVTHAFRVPALGGIINIQGVIWTLGTSVLTHNWVDRAYGVLPGIFPGWGEGATINFPAIFVRLSA